MKRFLQRRGLKVFVAGLCLAGFAVSNSSALAQEFLKNYAPPLADATLIPEAEFNAKTTLHEDAPAGDQALAYSFRLPSDWVKPTDAAMTNYQVSNKVLGEVVRYYGPPVLDNRSYFSMQVSSLEYKRTALHWLLEYLLANGYTIQGIKGSGENRAEALYVQVINDITYVIRTVAVINGKRIILAQYFMPADNWEAEKIQQAQVMSTFNLTHPVEEKIEELTKYNFLDVAQFEYPVSWQFKAAPLKSADSMSFELLNVISEQKIDWKNYKTLNGRIQVDIMSYDTIDTPEAQMETFKEGLSKFGLVLGEQIESLEDFKIHTDVGATNIEIYKAFDSANNLMDYEYWIMCMESGDYFYFVSLITPARDEDFFVWVRNSETYKLILQLFQPLADYNPSE